MKKHLEPKWMILSGIFLLILPSLTGPGESGEYVTSAEFIVGLLTILGLILLLFGVVGLFTRNKIDEKK